MKTINLVLIALLFYFIVPIGMSINANRYGNVSLKGELSEYLVPVIFNNKTQKDFEVYKEWDGQYFRYKIKEGIPIIAVVKLKDKKFMIPIHSFTDNLIGYILKNDVVYTTVEAFRMISLDTYLIPKEF